MRDYYSGQTDTVQNGKSRCDLPTATGFIAGTRGNPCISAFNWRNATVYFLLCLRDRFRKWRDATNDHSYGRHKDGMQEIGTFHGGDLRGLTSQLTIYSN